MKTNGNRWSISRSFTLKLSLVVLAALWLLLIASTWAGAGAGTLGSLGDAIEPGADAAEVAPNAPDSASAAAAAPAPAGDSDYNFNWLDPEKKIYVLQNRKYTKANKFLLSVMGGPGFSNPYRTVYNFDPRIAYYMSEEWGVEGFYTLTFNQQNNTYQALEGATTTLPVVREIKSQAGGLVHWVPWYAKINVFNKILYFDWYFSGGLGQIQSTIDTRTSTAGAPQLVNQSLFSMFWGTGHEYHLSERFSVRLDFTGASYRAPDRGNAGDNAWYTNLNFALGVGIRL